ncbi:DUF2798 domain-containing protein [Campylobacter suis]|uniref:DUF2798 domain-containing protein n=1 Tax=Campylobacter suis TaxID=2790657 RepID=A0ABM8Q8U8_9BACT|nr:DUF2798 domain-containing protein [Campylobacter suis]CAD7289392.1 hypothetical protein LMG8286_01778 [Campylobacter suis]
MFPVRYFRFVFAFIMALFMSFIISGALSFLNLGLVDDFIKIWIINWGKAFVLAYPCVLIISPLATKMTKAICKE